MYRMSEQFYMNGHIEYYMKMEKQFSLLELISSVCLEHLERKQDQSKKLNWTKVSESKWRGLSKKGKIISIKIQADKFFYSELKLESLKAHLSLETEWKISQ